MRIDSAFMTLQLPSDTLALSHFYAALHQLRTDSAGRVGVLHIGGSHVQAGTLSDAIRRQLTPVGDRGILFPFRAVRTNGPSDVTYEYTGLWRGSRCVHQIPEAPLGLTGTVAITSDSAASITLSISKASPCHSFRQITLLGETSDASVIPILVTQKGDTVKADTILSRIADVSGTWVFELPEASRIITLRPLGLTTSISPKLKRTDYHPQQDAHWFVLRGFIPQSGESGVTYTECGINGAAVPSWLRATSHFEEELSLLPPQLVIFGIGINDANVPQADFDTAAFKRDYRQLIARIRSVSPQSSLLFITNNDCLLSIGRSRRVPNPNTAKACEAFYALAREEGAALFDVYHLMGGQKSSASWMEAGMMKRDRIHFTNEGYRLIGRLLSEAILNDYNKYYATEHHD